MVALAPVFTEVATALLRPPPGRRIRPAISLLDERSSRMPGFTRTAFEENLTKPDRSLAPYNSVRAGMEVHMRNGVAAGDAPEVVAATVVKAAAAAAPRRRYAAGRLARRRWW
jgi:hypothetical protein